MISINRALRSDRVVKAVVGLSVSEFDGLSENFGQVFEGEEWNRYGRGVKSGDRERRPGGGRKGNLRVISEKLFFILFYFKCYPTFDILGVLFDLDRSNACRNVQKLTPILEKTLGRDLVLPYRKINSLEELFEIFPETKDLFIDGTERPIQRPKDYEKQKKNYSGKKKMHTRKNLIISDKNRRIGYLSPTAEGKKHDYRIFKEIWPPPTGIDQENTIFWLDLGFIGIDKDYPDLNVVMPKKKPIGTELTDEEKTRNKEISGFRVLVEHAISGIKRFKITTDKFRNRKYGFDDTVILISSGLWNYHLKCC